MAERLYHPGRRKRRIVMRERAFAVRDRIALAYPGAEDEGDPTELAGLAIWASASDEVDAKILEQINARALPIRLKPEEWVPGDNNWVLDVVAPDKEATARAIANFGKIAKQGSLKLHPMVAALVDEGSLEKMSVKKSRDVEQASN